MRTRTVLAVASIAAFAVLLMSCVGGGGGGHH
jgi:hypothetical protein